MSREERGADAAVGVALAEVERRAGDEGKHQRLGDPAGLDQALRLAERVVKPERKRGIEHAEES